MNNVININKHPRVVTKNKASIPDYTVNLLFAAKAIVAEDNKDIEFLVSNLEEAIISFEEKMPVKDGFIRIQQI